MKHTHIKHAVSALMALLLATAMLLPQAAVRADPAETAEETTTYTIQRGDTWWGLATRYGVSISRLLETNNVQATYGLGGQGGNLLWLYPRQTVILPIELGYTPRWVNPFLYTVQPGETLSQIAYRFGQSLYHLRLANGLAQTTTTVSPGTTLLMPAGPHYHRLQSNETLADVAAPYGVTSEYLLRYNNSGIMPGTDIYIPIQYDRPFTPMYSAATAAATVAATTTTTTTAAAMPSAQPAPGTPAPSNIVDEGGALVFRWFGFNSYTPDAYRGIVKLKMVAEFRGGVAPYTLTIGGDTLTIGEGARPLRGPYLKTDNGQQWTNLEFDWQTNCEDTFILPGTLTSADGQSAFMANTIGPFSCD